jgi:hypothetical protein
VLCIWVAGLLPPMITASLRVFGQFSVNWAGNPSDRVFHFGLRGARSQVVPEVQAVLEGKWAAPGGTHGGTGGTGRIRAEMSVPPSTLLGTALSEYFPFEYHLYRLYHPGENGSVPGSRTSLSSRAGSGR